MQKRAVLVTGSGSGIGRAIGLAFVAAGYAVAVSDIDPDAGGQTVALAERLGGVARFFRVDVADPASVKTLVTEVASSFGGIYAAVNNAGISGPRSPALLHEYGHDDWRRVVDINLSGVWHCMREEINHMLSAGGGVIVNMASRAGLVGGIGRCAYYASKHGVVGLTKVAALEYADRGIRVNAVCPGPVLTPLLEDIMQADALTQERLTRQSPMNRLATPAEVAEAVVWLCSDVASYINGVAMPIDGGSSAG